RQTADAEASYQSAIRERATQALSNATGVNVDEEMTILLELERSYEASARLMSAIDTMYAALLQAAG
ncbi:MAG: flagellar basal body rod C-terminal domain-containing protein, partial [Aestuariivirgaceae bacterium]